MDEMEDEIRALVSEMYKDLHGAYGKEFYSGEYECEIKNLADAIRVEIVRLIIKESMK